LGAIFKPRPLKPSALLTRNRCAPRKTTTLTLTPASHPAPWLEHTGLWKYPSGKGPDNDLRKPFVPESYLADSSFDDVDTDVSLSDEDDDSEMSDEEIENLLAELRDNT